MAARDIIVIGASAGGIVALVDFFKSLPADLEASFFVVAHVPPYAPSSLPEILSRSGSLPAVHPRDGEKIEKGKIYVAPPNHHLLLEKDCVVVKRGPKENRFRPSVDALFRSAAYNYGPRVVGIILSGLLNDGTSGMWTIKRLGGLAIIQDPAEAQYPDMPVSVLDEIKDVDHVLPASEMGPLLSQLKYVPEKIKEDLSPEEMKRLQMEIVIATQDNAFEMGIMEMGQFTEFTCPECNGALVSLKEGTCVRYRCHTGHAFTISALLSGVTKTVEENLWRAMRGLEETTMMLEVIARNYEEVGNSEKSELLKQKAAEIRERAQIIHDSVLKVEHLSLDHLNSRKKI